MSLVKEAGSTGMSVSREAKIWLAVTSSNKYARAATSGAAGAAPWAWAVLGMPPKNERARLMAHPARRMNWRDFENRVVMMNLKMRK
jgi:hypothetical protein